MKRLIMNTETKKCPYCGEEISINAKKCIHCKEWLESPTSTIQPMAPGQQAVSPAQPRSKEQLPFTNSPRMRTSAAQQVVVNQIGQQSNGLGTAGFVMALISLILCWIPGVSWVVWFLGMLFSFIGLFKSPRGLAIAGFIISWIDLILIVAIVGSIASLFS